MKTKHLSLFIIILFCFTKMNSQSINTLLKEVHQLREQRVKHMFSDKRDSIFTLFDTRVQELIRSAEFCDYELDSLFVDHGDSKVKSGKYLAYRFMNNLMKCSSDQKLRIFSWDDLGGGSYHSYTNYIQYKDKHGKCITKPFDEHPFDTEVGYYNIESLTKNKRTIYILFGYGTYGGGQHHRNIRFIEFVNDQAKECFEWYPNGKNLVIYSSRGQNPEITFDKEKAMISYKAFVFNDDIGFYEKEFELKKIFLFPKQ